jgi:Arc/MetJ-type ribon-helix-helix transcriptional regulator
MKLTAFRLNDEDLAILDEAKRKGGMISRADALRFLLRYWARREKVDVESLTLKRKKVR